MPAEPREYRPKMDYYFELPEDVVETFDRKQHRENLIQIVLHSAAKPNFKDHAHLIDTTDGWFVWKEDKIRELDDVALYAVSSLASRRNNE